MPPQEPFNAFDWIVPGWLDHFLWIALGIALFIAAAKVVFFFVCLRRSMHNTALNQLLGAMRPPETPEHMELRYRSRHSTLGLAVGVLCILIGLLLTLLGLGGGEMSIGTGPVEVNRAGPGIAFLVVGAVIIKTTHYRPR